MSTLTKEQVLKFAAAWQAMMLLVTWYMNTLGIDTFNRLLFGIALLVVLVILFLKRNNIEKVAVAVGTVDRFLKEQQETEKTEEPEEETPHADEFINAVAERFMNWLVAESSKVEPASKVEEVNVGLAGHVDKDLGSATDG